MSTSKKSAGNSSRAARCHYPRKTGKLLEGLLAEEDYHSLARRDAASALQKARSNRWKVRGVQDLLTLLHLQPD